MEIITGFAQHPLLTIGFILVVIYLLFWIFVSVAIAVSPSAREKLGTFLPQWFNRNGRPFTRNEIIGACFQGFALVLIVLFIFL